MTESTDDAIHNVDLSTCDREPIHIPGSIQPHGMLLALTRDAEILQASRNAEQLLGRPLDRVLGSRLQDVLPEPAVLSGITEPTTLPVYVKTLTLRQAGGGPRRFQTLVHRNADTLIVEFEQTVQDEDLAFRRLQPLVWNFMTRLGEARSSAEVTEFTAREIRAITGFDRVLIYRFDEDWNGTVVAEDRNDRLPAYLDHRFPASDIPAQARELYRLNRLRLIPDANYVPVPILRHPDTPNAPLDLSYSVLRSVSPIHVAYMKNMGTMSSMSISILQEGRLWGLISCHHAEPRHVGFDIRTACDMIGQMFSLQLAARQHSEHGEARLRSKHTHSQIIAHMAQEERFMDGLIRRPDELLSLVDAGGAAVLFEGECHLLGNTPDEEQVRAIADWLVRSEGTTMFATDSLSSAFPQGLAYIGKASGLLAIAISKLHRSYILWFRPEVIQTIKWGGDPTKPVEAEAGQMRIHPRKSFEVWKETVRSRSMPWTDADREAATDLCNSIVGIVLRKAEELAELSAELERSNRELEAFSYSVSHDLRAPFRHIVGYSELLREQEAQNLSETGNRFINTIIESAQFAGTLVDNLLTFSQIGRTSLTRTKLDMNVLVREVQRRLAPDVAGRSVELRVAPLPAVEGDGTLLRLAIYNLLANAVKYTRSREHALIHVVHEAAEREDVFCVRDNGVGFDMAYVDKLFGVFQRLHRMEEFEGTGIGLANVRRIISRHGGRTWAEGKLDQGASFYFSLPRSASEEIKN